MKTNRTTRYTPAKTKKPAGRPEDESLFMSMWPSLHRRSDSSAGGYPSNGVRACHSPNSARRGCAATRTCRMAAQWTLLAAAGVVGDVPVGALVAVDVAGR